LSFIFFLPEEGSLKYVMISRNIANFPANYQRMKKSGLLLILMLAVLACKNEKKDKKFDTETYEKVKETLAEKEQKSPASFLVVSSHKRKNLIGQTVVLGTITNTATIAWYKDVELKLSFYSKTAVRLDEGLETVYENIGPGKTVKFKTKYFAPKGTDSVFVSVTKAKASNTE
jgi:hypothetical protein